MIDPMPGDIFHPGQVLNNTYEIEGVLGRGGTGEVYRARNQVTGRIVAIKALNSQFSGNDDYVGLMRREEQMRDIIDDAVVRYSECSRTDQGHVFLVMDFIDGPSLNEAMARGRMDVRELLIVAHRVAQGLAAAHKRGIVHRDLSPDNVILRGGQPEHATIIDFGIAKDTAAGARTIVGNEFAGKYEYAAPEQLEGRAEARSDLYALGALLLAAYRGQVPFAGATPGEMIRRKQSPLDTGGVPEPLKKLIGTLTAPDPADRPQSAVALLTELDKLLKPSTGRGSRADAQPAARSRPLPGDGGKHRSPLVWVALPLLLIAAGGAGGYYGGVFDRFLIQPLPVASPYRLTASVPAEGAPAFAGNAPDAETAALLAAAFARASGVAPAAGALTLATGMPTETWASAAAAALESLPPLEDWRFEVTGTDARIEAVAPDAAARDQAAERLNGWAATNGFRLSLSLVTGPRILSAAEVDRALGETGDCGPLRQQDAPADGYAIGDRILITGDVGGASAAAAIAARLRSVAGDRNVDVQATVLNDDLCAVRRVLPALPANDLSIWIGDGATGAANLSGVFHVDENPIVDVLAPATLAGASLWVVVVDNTGKVFNLVPNRDFPEHRIESLGVVENGVRRVRVMASIEEFKKDTRLLAMRVTPSDFGKSEVVAILSRENLFEIARPRDESVASFAEALGAIQSERPGNIIGVATRLLDSRP